MNSHGLAVTNNQSRGGVRVDISKVNKGLIVQLELHRMSRQTAGPYVAVACALAVVELDRADCRVVCKAVLNVLWVCKCRV